MSAIGWTFEEALACAHTLAENSGRFLEPVTIELDGVWWHGATNGLIFVARRDVDKTSGESSAAPHAVMLREQIIPKARTAATRRIKRSALSSWCSFSRAGLLDGHPIDRTLIELGLDEIPYGTEPLLSGWEGDMLALVTKDPEIVIGIMGLRPGMSIAPTEITFADLADFGAS